MGNNSQTQYLGKLHHPAIGVRLPEIFLNGILNSLEKNHTAGTLMLSFGRETAPEFVINASPGQYPITLGHTGTSIRKYQTMVSEEAKKRNLPVEIEADHLIIIGSATKAVKRIAGVYTEERISQEELKKSLDYNYRCVDEAIETGVVNFFTVDTSDLYWLEADNLSGKQLESEFNRQFNAEQKEIYFSTYRKKFTFSLPAGQNFTLEMGEADIMRLALKFYHSIEVTKQLYDYISTHLNRKFGFEISLDETQAKTRPEELFFYLNEWKKLGHVDYVAPNIGFHKRADYAGDLSELSELVAKDAAIANSFDGALLSIHSGSGTSPYSGKGKGTYNALLKGTGGKLKYKISGVYFELLLEILSSYSSVRQDALPVTSQQRNHPGSAERIPTESNEQNLFKRIFTELLSYLKKEVERDGPLSSPLLRQQLKNFAGEINPRSDFFRFYSYLVLNFRNTEGKRYFRDALIELYQSDTDFHKKVDAEVEALTTRLIEGLKFQNNFKIL